MAKFDGVVLVHFFCQQQETQQKTDSVSYFNHMYSNPVQGIHMPKHECMHAGAHTHMHTLTHMHTIAYLINQELFDHTYSCPRNRVTCELCLLSAKQSYQVKCLCLCVCVNLFWTEAKYLFTTVIIPVLFNVFVPCAFFTIILFFFHLIYLPPIPQTSPPV